MTTQAMKCRACGKRAEVDCAQCKASYCHGCFVAHATATDHTPKE